MLTPLSQLFITERHRLRAGNVGHSVPLASEVDMDDRALEPLMVSTTRGTFLPSRIARDGFARFGFSECGIEREGALLLEFHKQLVQLSTAHGWECVVDSPEIAVSRMRDHGEIPFHLAAGPWIEVDDIGGARVLDVGLPQGLALLVTTPSKAGLYTRIGDYVGVLAHRVDRFFVAVVPA